VRRRNSDSAFIPEFNDKQMKPIAYQKKLQICDGQNEPKKSEFDKNFTFKDKNLYLKYLKVCKERDELVVETDLIKKLKTKDETFHKCHEEFEKSLLRKRVPKQTKIKSKTSKYCKTKIEWNYQSNNQTSKKINKYQDEMCSNIEKSLNFMKI
jgi:hypothetical protein